MYLKHSMKAMHIMHFTSRKEGARRKKSTFAALSHVMHVSFAKETYTFAENYLAVLHKSPYRSLLQKNVISCHACQARSAHHAREERT